MWYLTKVSTTSCEQASADQPRSAICFVAMPPLCLQLLEKNNRSVLVIVDDEHYALVSHLVFCTWANSPCSYSHVCAVDLDPSLWILLSVLVMMHPSSQWRCPFSALSSVPPLWLVINHNPFCLPAALAPRMVKYCLPMCALWYLHP